MNLISDEPIAAGDGESIYWTLYGYDDAKTAKLWLYSVYFADGSQWGARDGLSLEQIQEFGVNLTAQ